MTVAPHQLRRSRRLWALGLLAWLALNALAIVPMGHAMAGGAMGNASHAAAMADAGAMGHVDGEACCGQHGQVPCHCPAACAALALPSMPTLPTAVRWSSTGPQHGTLIRAPRRDDGPPLRPPLA